MVLEMGYTGPSYPGLTMGFHLTWLHSLRLYSQDFFYDLTSGLDRHEGRCSVVASLSSEEKF